MNFDLDDEQAMLAHSLAGFFDRYDFSTRRAIIVSDAGWSPSTWAGLADEIGVLGALAPEAAGGFGGGAVEAMILGEAAGRVLLIEPLLETAVVAVDILARAGGAIAHALLARIAAGEAIVTLAHAEAEGRHSGVSVSTRAQKDGAGWRIDGTKAVVASAPLASHLLVTARLSGNDTCAAGIAVFLVPVGGADPAALTIDGYHTIDDRHAADIRFSGLRLPDDALLGPVDAYATVIAPALDVGAVAQCAEAVGVLRELHRQTLDYVAQRRQFGQLIGKFQVIQHRLADMFGKVEDAVSLTYMATLKLGAPDDERERSVAAACVGVAKALRFVAQNAVQLHGGIGMTDELPLSHYFRRASAIEIQLGAVRTNLRRMVALDSHNIRSGSS